MNHRMPGLRVHHQLPESTQTHVHRVGDAIQPFHPLSSPSADLNFPSIRVFSNESALCIRWPKYWSFSLNISFSNEHPGLISFIFNFFNLNFYFYFILLYNTVLVLAYIDMNPPRVYMHRMDWLDLLAVQGTLKSLLQHHSSKASILWCSAFFIVQLPHPYMTNGKTIALTRRTFVGKVMSLLFTMLSRLFITFLPKSKRLLISWLQSPSAVIPE